MNILKRYLLRLEYGFNPSSLNIVRLDYYVGERMEKVETLMCKKTFVLIVKGLMATAEFYFCVTQVINQKEYSVKFFRELL